MKWLALPFGLVGVVFLAWASDACARDYVNEAAMVGAAFVFMAGAIFGMAHNPVRMR